ncbi:hypothetical protein HS041_28060 [Planomonospora sp. ID67723]|uniref:hypothetical protein n=1 Tax=Planomonospora sp. ID67723 TaxID=2738134 RepID=UPI0018C39B31|nr:hypothetical protein [Planomonospora sp. ID67723]MBG0831592.1 hypothetical protein [Planomonospora sp. ID67723]
MSSPTPEEDLPVLLPEVEQQALLTYVTNLLSRMPLEQVHQAIDSFTEPGRAAAVVLQRRRQAAAARQHIAELMEDSRRRDPEGVARAEEQVRRSLETIDAKRATDADRDRLFPCTGILPDSLQP